MERALFRFFRMDWNHEPDNAVGARLCEPQHVATTPSSAGHRSEEHTSELQSLTNFVCGRMLTRNRSGSDRGRSPPAAAAQKPVRGGVSRGAGARHTLRAGTAFGLLFFLTTHARPEIYTLSLHDALPILDWNHEPDNAVGARLCEPQHVATTPSSAGH